MIDRSRWATIAAFEREFPQERPGRPLWPARPRNLGFVWRKDCVPQGEDAPYLTRDGAGRPNLWLVRSVDRLMVWSPMFGGALINPKSTALRRFGLISSYVRGGYYYSDAFRDADLRPGSRVELHAEPDNPHDRNAVALHAPGDSRKLGFVQRGRAPAVARRIREGEDMAALSMFGPGPRSDDDESSLLLVGHTLDLAWMLRP